MNKSKIMSKKVNNKVAVNIKNKKLHFSKICRSCLSQRGHLRELFSTRLPRMIENCVGIQVSQDDELPSKVCLSCFHQIAKLYSFKRKLERNDKILRSYLKQKKLKEPKYQDILHKAVNDAEIEGAADRKNDIRDNISDDNISDFEDIPLSEIILRNKTKPSRLLRKSKQKANLIIDTIIKNDQASYLCEDEVDHSSEIKSESLICHKDAREEIMVSAVAESYESVIFDGPPPLVPLAPSRLAERDPPPLLLVDKKLSENTPPLVPIKPLTDLHPVIIVNALSDSTENPVDLKLQCNSCNEEFHSVLALKKHRLHQCPILSMQCNICKKEFNDRARLIGHLKGHMVTKDYECKICGKRYPNPSTFRVHMRTHTGERPFRCQICNKGFVRWAGVIGHLKTHTPHKPYKCETCGKGFKIPSNLERHKILHSGILPYCCSYCGKTFSQSDNLQLHIRTYHTNDRPYLCNECGKCFVSSTRLKRHMWVHTGYKPYRCRYCPKAYSNSNDRKTHEKSHTGGISEADKPHVCATCNMRFMHACRLSKHMKTHERPYPCTDCTKTFSSELLLNRHLSSKHGAQLLEHLSMPLSVEEVYINYE